MAISKKVGQDSEGFPIFKRDKEGDLTDELDHDLDEILADFKACHEGTLTPSEYRFSIKRSDIGATLKVNPQLYLPNLNETIRRIESIDGRDGWSVSTIGQIVTGIQIFKGPRLKSENIIVETPGPNVEPYYTPSAVLQEKSESAKLLDISKATPAQLRTIAAIRVHKGDIVITRSGTIGRVAIITKRLDGAIASDDLIRVRIPDEDIRLYILTYLQSSAALDQMLRNEYGSVQQHLEPNHVSDILIPVPSDWSTVAPIIQKSKQALALKESLEELTATVSKDLDGQLEGLTKERTNSETNGSE
jgi:hypothetical protein